MTRFPALEHPQFRRYFIGQSIALIGGFAYNVALAWLAFRLTGSVAVLGVVGFASLAPLGPMAGQTLDAYFRAGGPREVGDERRNSRLLAAFAGHPR